jgi:hypothetical protein
MEQSKKLIEEVIINIGLTVEDCYDSEKEWYVINKGSATLIIYQSFLPISNSTNYRNVIGFVSPMFKLSDNMPIEFYKEVLFENSQIGDGTSFGINQNNYLQIALHIEAYALTKQLITDAIGTVLNWSDKFDDELMEKYKTYLS